MAETEKRMAAEAKAEQLAAKQNEIPEEIAGQLREKDAEIARITGQARDLLSERNALSRDLRDAEEMIREQQEEYDRVQAELLESQSRAAKGDAEREVNDRLTAAEFSRAVGQFIGLVCQIPHMGRSFAAMGLSEREGFDAALKAVEKWTASARQAMNTVEGVMIHAE